MPIPASSIAATRGISNINGTLINIPIVATTRIPNTSSPIQRVTVFGLTHCIARPLKNPAIIIIGASLRKYPAVDRINSIPDTLIVSAQESSYWISSSSGKSIENSSVESDFSVILTIHATNGPITNAPPMLKSMRVPAIVGANTIAAIANAKKFIVAEL